MNFVAGLALLGLVWGCAGAIGAWVLDKATNIDGPLGIGLWFFSAIILFAMVMLGSMYSVVLMGGQL